jgi:hypothetical protein
MAANPDAVDAKPRPSRGGEARSGERRKPRGASALSWLLAGLLAFVIGAAVVQTRRLDRMTARADELAAKSEALQGQLSQAQARIDKLEAQRGLVRESVADLAQRIAALYEIGQPGGAPPPAPRAEPPESEPGAAPSSAEASAQLPHPEGR